MVSSAKTMNKLQTRCKRAKSIKIEKGNIPHNLGCYQSVVVASLLPSSSVEGEVRPLPDLGLPAALVSCGDVTPLVASLLSPVRLPSAGGRESKIRKRKNVTTNSTLTRQKQKPHTGRVALPSKNLQALLRPRIVVRARG